MWRSPITEGGFKGSTHATPLTRMATREADHPYIRRSGTPTTRGRGLDSSSEVYDRCMARTNVDIDEEACRAVMSRYHLATKREAVNLALRLLAGEPLSVEAARALRGSG